MATRLVLVRHGESVHSAEGVVGGPRSCRGLTELGHDQAAALAARLGAELAVPAAVYSSTLRRATETARPIAVALGAAPVEDCGLCTWHTPAVADGMPTAGFQAAHAVPGGGVFQPFEAGNESWAELVVRVGRAITAIAQRHAGGTAVLVGHSETVEASFHVLAGQPLYRAFDLEVAPASITEWFTDGDPSAWPPARWTLRRFNA
ncbi:histidine phosphatase family protein [Actinoplanes sp. NPDC051861]|uniref:histidine phosphatase family protein n=1 Tax=Actinoplanes sp. NPDC051861 TaxID=3155170 RepID=UPI003423B8E1